MNSLPDSDAERGASRLRDGLAAPGLPGAVAAYSDPAEGFAGMVFTCLGSNPRHEVTTDDLLAVSLLDIAWQAGRGADAPRRSRAEGLGILAAISSRIDLQDATDAGLATVDPLWDALRDMPGVGTVTAARLLARERPRLCPVTDRVVIRAGVPGRTTGPGRARDPDRAAGSGTRALRRTGCVASHLPAAGTCSPGRSRWPSRTL
jgi:hypothetical protein